MTKLNVSVTADLKPPEATIHEGSQGTTLVNNFLEHSGKTSVTDAALVKLPI